MKFPTLRHPLAPFAIATLSPVPFLLLGGFLGAPWLVPAFLWLTVVKLAADKLLPDMPRLSAWPGRQPSRADRPAQNAAPADPTPAPLTAAPVVARDYHASAEEPEAGPLASHDEIDSTIASLLRHEAAITKGGHAAFAPLAADEGEPAPSAARRASAPERAGNRLPSKELLSALTSRLASRLAGQLAGRARPSAQPAQPLSGPDRLSVLLAGAHFLLLIAAIYGLSGRAGYGPVGWFIAFFAFGIWFGQVSNSNAHELIHRRDRRLRALGATLYVTMLFGHHASAHRLVHHRFVATLDDPNTAQMGESFYRFVLRAWPGSFIAGYEMEFAIRQRRAARRRVPPVHPYLWYLGGSALTALIVVLFFGFTGFLAWLLLAGYVQLQLLLSDYVQHYGLRRRALSLGKVEPLGARHSWDAPKPFSSALMLNAPHHADHHLHPDRGWADLNADRQSLAPILPYSLPVMGAIALWPAKWRQVMDKRVKMASRTA
jgi:alkane 1-monooxygenase